MLFEAAREFARAADYYLVAAENAARIFAHQEAVALARRGLELLETLPDSPERARQELALQIALGPPLMATVGMTAPEVERTYSRAGSCAGRWARRRSSSRRCGACCSSISTARRSQSARTLAGQLLSLAQHAQDPALLLEAHHALGATYMLAGDWVSGLAHMEQGIALYDPQQHRATPSSTAAMTRAYAAWAVRPVAYGCWAIPIRPCGAVRRPSRWPESCPTRPRWLYAQLAIGLFHQFRRDGAATLELAEALVGLSAEQGLPTYWAGGSVLRGWALAEGGHAEEGIAQIHQGWSPWPRARLSGDRVACPAGRCYGKGGKVEEGLAVLASAEGGRGHGGGFLRAGNAPGHGGAPAGSRPGDPRTPRPVFTGACMSLSMQDRA